jgi:hypothetical protein
MRVFRVARVVLAALAAAAVSGCIQSSTLIKVKPDGSGTIDETITMTAEAAAQLSALAAMGNDKDKQEGKGGLDDLFSDKQARDAVAKMGQGVTFVSSEKIDTPERKGLKAIYAFTDIRKLSLEEMHAPDAGGNAAGMPGAAAQQKDPPMTFDFKQLPGGNGLLTILQPGVEKAMKASDTTAPPKAAADPKMAQQGIEMMKAFMKGLKIDVAIQVPRLVKTSSPYADGGTVTLLSMDFDKVLADPAMLERMNGATTLAETKAALKDFKGIKINLEPQVTIEFAGR